MASDGFWKDAIEAYFKDFMELFWPVAHGDIDWSQPVVWRDKELQKLLPDSGPVRRPGIQLCRPRRPQSLLAAGFLGR